MEDKIRELLAKQPGKGLELAMKQYMALCWSVVRNHLAGIGTKEDMEDCVSDAFAALYEARERLDAQKGTVKSFLIVIARRKAIDCYHRLNQKRVKEEGHKENEKDVSVEFAEEITDRKVLLDALKALGEPDTQIFVRKYYLGQSTKEIAAALDLKENTVDKKVERGLVKLRNLLEGGRIK